MQRDKIIEELVSFLVTFLDLSVADDGLIYIDMTDFIQEEIDELLLLANTDSTSRQS